MTAPVLTAMLKHMAGVWPRAVDWDWGTAFPAWFATFEPYTDEDVRQGFMLMTHDRERNQQWPPSAPELLGYVLQFREAVRDEAYEENYHRFWRERGAWGDS